MFIIKPGWDIPNIVAGFSKAGPVSAPDVSGTSDAPIPGRDMGINTRSSPELTDKNRRKMLMDLGLSPGSLAYLKQIHGHEVVTASYAGLLGEADGLVTTQAGLALGILVADCAAVLIADPETGVIGAFHAGWRGAVGGIVENGLNRMKELGAKTFRVWMSPCIGLSAFEVGDEVAAKFPAEYIHHDGFIKPHVDLKTYLFDKLQLLGVDRDCILADERCTFNNHEFYSFRRQGPDSGRMLAVISLKS